MGEFPGHASSKLKTASESIYKAYNSVILRDVAEKLEIQKSYLSNSLPQYITSAIGRKSSVEMALCATQRNEREGKQRNLV